MELKALAVSQYTEVPSNSQNVQKLKHVSRNLNKKEMPKRARVIYDLFRYLVKDYLTLAITLVLLVTFWRTINTLEILYDYAQRYRKGGVSFMLEYKLKDVSLQKRLFLEFRNLLRDFIVLFIFILTLLMLHRAKSVIKRIKGVSMKKKERKELQTVEYFKKFQMLRRVSKKVEESQAFDEKKPKKRIVNLNKNVMSIALPYLSHDELLRAE